MKSLTYTLFFILFLLPLAHYGQGINGKRLVVNYQMQMASNYDLPNYNEKFQYYPPHISANLVHIIELNFILNEKWQVGPDVHSFRLRSVRDEDEYAMFLHNRGWGFHVQHFNTRKGGVAPVGSWWKIRIYNNQGEATRVVNGAFAGDYSQWDLSISTGKQIAVMGSFLVNAGFGVDLNNLSIVTNDDPSFPTTTFRREIVQSLFSHQALFVNLGIGFNGGL